MRWILLLVIAGSALANAQALTPAWVELGPSGQTEVRVIVDSPQGCPAIMINGASEAMKLREPIPAGLRPVCEFALLFGVKTASVNGQTLALPRKNPRKIVVIGDTGCRVKGARVQDCNDPAKWPFAEVSSLATSERPELVIHVGDYLYRESPCPVDQKDKCGGSPAGDNWEAWNADFFTPAAKLLAAEPWAFSRGNHEDCTRSWRGWFYYLDPRPYSGACEKYSRPYQIKLGKFELAMLDSSPSSDFEAEPDQVAEYAKQLSSLNVKNAWLVDHHPFWALQSDFRGGPAQPLSVALEAAWDRAAPKGIDAIVSGHVHLFEVLSYAGQRPVQIVAGDGGTALDDPLPASVNGIPVHGAKIQMSETESQFGYTVLTRKSRRSHAWRLALKNRMRETLLTCEINPDSAECGAKK